MTRPVFLSRLSAVLLSMAVLAGSGFAQTTSPSHQCDKTLKRLERELAKLSESVSHTVDPQQESPTAPAKLLIELMKLEALTAHLRCLGTGRRADR